MPFVGKPLQQRKHADFQPWLKHFYYFSNTSLYYNKINFHLFLFLFSSFTLVDKNPMDDTSRMINQRRFLESPMKPPNLVTKVFAVNWSSETVFSTTLSNCMKTPEKARSLLKPIFLIKKFVFWQGTTKSRLYKITNAFACKV